MAAPNALAQMPTYDVGRAPTAEEVKAWDLTIPPDGQGLPPGTGTAVLGKPIYVERCASCHGEKGEDPKSRLLAGGRGTLTAREPVLTIGSFWPYATTLWGYINRSQPFDEPGSLTADEVYGDRLSPPPQRHHRGDRRHRRPDTTAGQDAKPRWIRARRPARRAWVRRRQRARGNAA